MERIAEIDRMLWEGCPNAAEPVVKNSRFPEVGSRRASVTDPVLRGVEELAMATGRIEKV